jgi:hypothetical protein
MLSVFRGRFIVPRPHPEEPASAGVSKEVQEITGDALVLRDASLLRMRAMLCFIQK